ncbi:MAG: DUF2461 domain-containing protein [Labilithrix sp.]
MTRSTSTSRSARSTRTPTPARTPAPAPTPASAFAGFADSEGRFFKALAKKNDRAWFASHKAEFEAGWNAPMKALLEELRVAIDAAYERVDLGPPKVFRIFRDTRFSKDKAPYKTHVGGYIPIERAGKNAMDLPMALYVQVGAKETFAAAGHYMMEKESLARFRNAVADDARGKELAALLRGLAKKGFVEHVAERNKRVPPGFPPDHPRAELLKSKGLTVMFPALPKELLTSRKLVPWLVKACKTTAPLVDWLALATA